MNSGLIGRGAGLGMWLVVLAGAAPAMGQNALGDGRGLEADLRQGGAGEAPQGNRPRSNFMNEVRARNAAVTGNAPNGQSLRIGSPYSAPDDFRGSLGTDSLFEFQRDSQSSGAYRGGRAALFSNYLGGNGAWRPLAPLISRLDTYGSGSTLPRSGSSVQSRIDAGKRVRPSLNAEYAGDQPNYAAASATANGKELGPLISSPVGTLRSTSAFASTTDLNPSFVGYQQSSSGGVSRVTASELLGVRMFESAKKDSGNKLTARQTAELPSDRRPFSAALPAPAAEGPDLSAAGTSFHTAYDDLKLRLEAVDPTPKPDTATKPNTILPAGQHPVKLPGDKTEVKPAGKPGADVTPDEKSWEGRIKKLREQLAAEKDKKKAQEKPDGGLITDPLKTPDLKPPDIKDGEAPGSQSTGKGEKTKNPYPMAGLDDETLALIRKAGGEASTYSAGTPGSLFDAHLKAGEADLAKGKYFDAEERFARALTMRPGDTTVLAARLNAQIGAGLYISAASNLRQLFQEHPETIGVRYTGNTMPAKDRLATMITEVREDMTRAKKDGLAPSPEFGLLLAYVGFQTGDMAAVHDGLAAVRETKDARSILLADALEGVWGRGDSK